MHTRETLSSLIEGRVSSPDGRSELVRLATRLILEEALGAETRDALGRDCNERGAPTHPITVFIDGAHVRCRPEYQKRHLDVVVGKIEGGDGGRHFGFAADATAAASHMRQELGAVGCRPDRALTVISDGEPGLASHVRNAVQRPVTHILDWWHVSMRVQHVETAVKGLLDTRGILDIATEPSPVGSGGTGCGVGALAAARAFR